MFLHYIFFYSVCLSNFVQWGFILFFIHFLFNKNVKFRQKLLPALLSEKNAVKLDDFLKSHLILS